MSDVPKQRLVLDEDVTCLAFSPDGRSLAIGRRDAIVTLRDAQSGERKAKLLNPDFAEARQKAEECFGQDLDWGFKRPELAFPFLSVAYSPDGKHLATVSDAGSEVAHLVAARLVRLDKMAKVWDLASGECTATLQGHSNKVRSVAYSPDGKHLATGSDDKTVRLWDAQSSQCKSTLEGHIATAVSSVAFSPDGRFLASGGADLFVRLWDVKAGTCEALLRGHTATVHSVAFSPDGRSLASGSEDVSIRLWDAQSFKCKSTLEGHTASVLSVAFSPDGRSLASASSDKTVRLWGAQSGVLKATLKGHSGPVCCVAFSPDGRSLASGSQDQTVIIWDLGPYGSSASNPATAAPGLEAGRGLEAPTQAPRQPAINDSAKGPDQLGAREYARALVQVLCSAGAEPPITVGLYAPWGAGKSFLMQLIHAAIREVNAQLMYKSLTRESSAESGADDETAKLQDLKVRLEALEQRLRCEVRGIEEVEAPATRPVQVQSNQVAPEASQPQPDARTTAQGQGPQQQQQLTAGEKLAKLTEDVQALQEEALQLKQRLDQKTGTEYRVVEFNSWLYSGSENLWAGLVQKLYDELEDHYGPVYMTVSRFWRANSVTLLVMIAILGSGAALIVVYQRFIASSSLATIVTIVTGIVTLVSSSAFFQARSKSLVQRASKPDFRDKIGHMAEIKDELYRIGQDLTEGRTQWLPPWSSDLRRMRRMFWAWATIRGVPKQLFRGYRTLRMTLWELQDQIEDLKSRLKDDPCKTVFLIFIDDLDRCPPHKVMEVLQSLVLLMEGTPFITILAIDPRIIIKTIEDSFDKPGPLVVATGAPGAAVQESRVSGYEYLDKIVQIPFAMPKMTKADNQTFVSKMISAEEEVEAGKQQPAQEQSEKQAEQQDDLEPALKPLRPVPSRPVLDDNAPSEAGLPEPESPAKGDPGPREPRNELAADAASTGDADADAADAASTADASIASTATADAGDPKEAAAPPPAPPDGGISLTRRAYSKQDQDAWTALGGYLSANPRRIKRLVNVYNIARQLAHRVAPAKLLKFLILCEQWPLSTAWMLQAIAFDQAEARLLAKGVSDASASLECLQPETDLRQVFDWVAPFVNDDVVWSGSSRSQGHGTEESPELFKELMADEPHLTVGDIGDFSRRDADMLHCVAINLNPALRAHVTQVAAQQIAQSSKGQPQLLRDHQNQSLQSQGYRHLLQCRRNVVDVPSVQVETRPAGDAPP